MVVADVEVTVAVRALVVVISVKERAIVVVEGNNATVATVVVVAMEEAAATVVAAVTEVEEAIVATLEVPGNKKEIKFQVYSVSYMFHIVPLYHHLIIIIIYTPYYIFSHMILRRLTFNAIHIFPIQICYYLIIINRTKEIKDTLSG